MTTITRLPDISPDKLESLRDEVTARKNFLQQRLDLFEARYQGPLAELERKLDQGQIEEHPAWEDSIEWRNAVEQLENIQLSESIFAWLQNLLRQSPTS